MTEWDWPPIEVDCSSCGAANPLHEQPPELFAHLDRYWRDFYAAHKDDPKTEFLLPTTVASLRDQGLLDVRVVHTDDEWIGVTNPDDLDPARARLRQLRA